MRQVISSCEALISAWEIHILHKLRFLFEEKGVKEESVM